MLLCAWTHKATNRSSTFSFRVLKIFMFVCEYCTFVFSLNFNTKMLVVIKVLQFLTCLCFMD